MRRLAFAYVLATGCVRASQEPSVLAAGQAQASALASEFTLLSWNTHKQRSRRFEAELEHFTQDVDLVLLQEAIELEPVWALLPEARAWTLVVAFEYGRDEVGTGVATGSTATALREQPLLSPRREPLLCTPKSALVSWLEIDGADAPLMLVNLHGINFRRAQLLAAQLDMLDALLEDHAGPAIVAGDFNTWSRARRKVVEDFARRHQLRSPFDEWTKLRFDNVYARGLEVVHAEVLPSRSSDHDALRVQFSLSASGH